MRSGHVPRDDQADRFFQRDLFGLKRVDTLEHALARYVHVEKGLGGERPPHGDRTGSGETASSRWSARGCTGPGAGNRTNPAATRPRIPHSVKSTFGPIEYNHPPSAGARTKLSE